MNSRQRYLSRICPSVLLAVCMLIGAVACAGQGSTGDATSGNATQSATATATGEIATTGGSTETESEQITTGEETSGAEQEETMKPLESMLNSPAEFPISFTYGGVRYQGFGDGFSVTERKDSKEADGTRTFLTLENPEINAVFVLEAKAYPRYGAYEYRVTVENRSDTDTKVIDNLCYRVTIPAKNAVLKGIDGDAGSSWYEPYETKLTSRWIRKESTSGRPSHNVFPYFNLQHDDGGTMIAIGWPGTWKAHFRAEGDAVTMLAGQYKFSSYLKPGESARTPLLAFVEYEGGEDAATNAWRHWFIDCNMARAGEKQEVIPTMIVSSSMSSGVTTPVVKLKMAEFYRHGINLDAFWLDAGWYTGIGTEPVAWPLTGSLRMDANRFPDRMADITKILRSRNAGLILWFEPEVVRLDSQAFLADNPDFSADWLLGRVMKGIWLEGDIIDFGNPAAVNWVFDRVCKVIDDAGGIRVYRQDFNCDPAAAWKAHDDKGRTGMTENRYVCGYLQYWDMLLERYPDMYIDSCASGGGRNDLETMRRSVPLHYSDLFDGTITEESYGMKLGMTQELFKWFPYFKNQSTGPDNSIHQFRINYAGLFSLTYTNGSAEMWGLFKQAQDEYNLIRSYLYSDYYPLTDSSKKLSDDSGWEFFDPSRGEGFFQVFRMKEAAPATLTVRLRGLDPEKNYHLTDTDGRIDEVRTGAELMAGYEIRFGGAPDSYVVLIKAL